MSKNKGPADHRSSETGRFVKEEFAKRNPEKTQREHNRSPPKKGK
jgi:hypothetical protein